MPAPIPFPVARTAAPPAPSRSAPNAPASASRPLPSAPSPRRARLLCDLVRLAVDGVAELAPDGVARLVGTTARGLQHRRQVAMYLAHVAFGVRTADVARGFGRDTTTVYHAYRQVEDMRDDAVFDAFLDAVENLVTGAEAIAREAGEAA